MQNNVSDLYSIFRFLQVKEFRDFAEFKLRISLPFANNKSTAISVLAKQKASEELLGIFNEVLLRRTKDSVESEKKILELPKCHLNIVRLEFSEQERVFYDLLRDKAQLQLDHARNLGNLVGGAFHMKALTLLLRLRQACNHPQLLGDELSDQFSYSRSTDDAIFPTDPVSDLLDAFQNMEMKYDTQKCKLCHNNVQLTRRSLFARNAKHWMKYFQMNRI